MDDLPAPACLGTGFMSVPPGWRAPVHSHGFTEILVIVKGRLGVRLAGAEYEATSGDVLTYPPGAVHDEWTASSTPSAFFLLATALPGWPPIAPLTQDSGSRVTYLARWIHEARGHLQADRQRISSAYLQALLGELALRSKAGGHSRLEQVRLYLQNHLEAHHSTAELAAQAGLSRFHFIRAYKKFAGLTPMEDLLKLRVEAACGLLLTSEKPLKAIARQVGFCDEYHLSKAFKKEMQIPPGTFRRRGTAAGRRQLTRDTYGGAGRGQ